MKKQETQLFEAIDVAYADPEIAKQDDLRKLLFTSAQHLQNGDPYQMVAVKLKNSISRYVALHQLDAPDALNKLYMKIGPMDDRDWALTQIFR